MAYAEKRNGKLTGKWRGEVDLRAQGGPRRKHAFDTLKEAKDYETYVRDHHGQEPPWAGGKHVAEGRSFREVAAACRDAGGPKRRWQKHLSAP